MTNLFQSKAVIWLCLLAGIIALAAIIVFKQSATKNSEIKSTELKVEQKDVDISKLPDTFPADIPLEAGAKITQNYNATTNDGRSQATRAFETTKTLDENYKIYTNYIKNGGWTLGTGVDQKNFKVITASKNGQVLQITMNLNLGTQVKTINITLSQPPSSHN